MQQRAGIDIYRIGEIPVVHLGNISYLFTDDEIDFFLVIRRMKDIMYDYENIERCYLRKHSYAIIKLIQEGVINLDPPAAYKCVISNDLHIFLVDFLSFSDPEDILLNECVKNFFKEERRLEKNLL
ncbi:putative 14-kDa putative protein [Citrus virus B]|nr:putative 14-kDa putative protein [Citrus virus B]